MNTIPRMLILSLALILSSCAKDLLNKEAGNPTFSFDKKTHTLELKEGKTEISIKFSEPLTDKQNFKVFFKDIKGTHIEDYYTIPQQKDGHILLSAEKGATDVNFFVKRVNNIKSQGDKLIQFSLTKDSNTNMDLGENNKLDMNIVDKNALVGLSGMYFTTKIEGAHKHYSVYIDLSEGKVVKKIDGESWDLGFYCGEQFRVTLNQTKQVYATEANQTVLENYDESKVEDELYNIFSSYYTIGLEKSMDNNSGFIEQTKIPEIVADSETKNTYLIRISDNKQSYVSGNDGLIYKIKIVRDGDDYLLYYANLNDTKIKEVRIVKDPTKNLIHFSLSEEKILNQEPEKDKFDLIYTPFNNVIDFYNIKDVDLNIELPNTTYGTYFYNDYLLINNKSNVTAALVDHSFKTYDQFSGEHLGGIELKPEQYAVGSSWRNVPTPIKTKFIVVKDTENNYYKLRFLTLESVQGARGHITLDYELVKK